MNVTEFIAGYAGGALAMTVVTPIDTVKSWIQHRPELSVFQVIRALLDKEGPIGFYRGYTFPVLTVGINSAAVFGIYHTTLDLLKEYRVPLNDVQQKSVAAGCGAFGQVNTKTSIYELPAL